MTLIIDADDVHAVCTMDSIIEAVERGLREEGAGRLVMPTRMDLPTREGFMRIMPVAMNDSGIMGFKAFHGSVQDGVRYLIAIYEQATGRLLAMMDAHYLTAARTGATTGVATKFMANRDARRVAVIGSGLEARTNLLGVCAVREVERVTVFSPNRERLMAFAQRMSRELKIEVRACDSPESCLEGADIAVVATNTTGKGDGIAFRGAWARAGMHINAIGSTMPKLREIDSDSFASAGRIVIDCQTGQLEEESGDVIDALANGKYDRGKVIELQEVAAGRASGREADDQITLFKSVGTAVQDVTAGYAVYQEARRLGIGSEVPDFLELKTF
jgi:ornithine cyclodeaminase/alanine dehydrogenase-like protein (mu-crystallin family)